MGPGPAFPLLLPILDPEIVWLLVAVQDDRRDDRDIDPLADLERTEAAQTREGLGRIPRDSCQVLDGPALHFKRTTKIVSEIPATFIRYPPSVATMTTRGLKAKW